MTKGKMRALAEDLYRMANRVYIASKTLDNTQATDLIIISNKLDDIAFILATHSRSPK